MGFQDAEDVCLKVLAGELDVPVYRVPPKNIPAAFVRVARVGGIARNLVTDSALMSVSAYGKNPKDAAVLAARCRDVLWDARASRSGGAWVRWWREVSGPVYYPEPGVDRTRYQFTGELRLATN